LKLHYEFLLQLNNALKSKVVVLWSGGLDTTGLIFLLLQEFTCDVYPIFVNRGQTNLEFEKASTKYYSDKFLKLAKDRFQCPFEVTIKIPPKEFDEFQPNAKYALRNSDIINQGVRYALEKNIEAILLGTFENEDIFGDGKKEYFNAKTNEVQIGTEKNFLICSAFHDKLFPQTKANLIKKCYKKDFELDKTRSCYKEFEKHCGESGCEACQNRRNAFKDAGIDDKTEYMITN